jgi:hypothetical protein
MAPSIIGWQEHSERLTGDHFPRVSDLLTLGGKVCCETKDIHLAAHGRADTNEVETSEVESNAHLHGLNTGIAQQMIERILNSVQSESPRCDTKGSNAPIVKTPFTVKACEDAVATEAVLQQSKAGARDERPLPPGPRHEGQGPA